MSQYVKNILKDNDKFPVGKFRYAMWNREPKDYDTYSRIALLRRVYPAALFTFDDNGSMVMKTFNGIVLLTLEQPAWNRAAHYDPLTNDVAFTEVKAVVAEQPYTYATFIGADGKSLHVLVRITSGEGTISTDESNANIIYLAGHKAATAIYTALTGWSVRAEGVPTVRDSFLHTIDPNPYLNEDCKALRVSTYRGSNVEQNIATEHSIAEHNKMTAMIAELKRLYKFRFNEITKVTEFTKANDQYDEYRAVDKRDLATFAVELGKAGIEVTANEVRTFVWSNQMERCNPITDYLWECYYAGWDGKDHIGALASMVKCDNKHWERWFRLWFLGMVNQWVGWRVAPVGNSVAPLLIGPQGFRKTWFCRSLLPEALAQWGYNANMLLTNKREVHRNLVQMLLINLDEFNTVSPKDQRGFMKNIMSLSTVKFRPPYAAKEEDFRRLASFIATTNVSDVLCDETGCRRFIAVELTQPIDMSVMPNHAQLFAQAMTAIVKDGERCWFDEVETALLIESNKLFLTYTPADELFSDFFTLAKSEDEGEWMTASAIILHIKSSGKAGQMVSDVSVKSFGRKLQSIPNIIHKRTAKGVVYRVIHK